MCSDWQKRFTEESRLLDANVYCLWKLNVCSFIVCDEYY
jgi:hypothetical protein